MRHVRSIAILAAALVSVFAMLLFTDGDGVPYRLIPWDFRSLCAPWLIYGWDLIRAGIWPLWCPYAGGGVPFFINPQTGLYSPLSILIGLLFGYSYRAAQIMTVAMLWIGGIGAYTLSYTIWRSRSAALVTAIGFELSSALFCHMEHFSIMAAACLSPWLFWAIIVAVEQRNRWGLPLLAWFVYWLATAGYIGVTFMIIPWCAALAIALTLRFHEGIRQRLRMLAKLAGACLVGGAMSAMTWLPFVLHTSEFSRGKPMTVDEALSARLSFAVRDAWGVLWSFLTQHPFPGTELDISMRGLYFGAIALVLAVVCLVRARGWAVGALFTLSLGTLLLTFGTYFFGRVLLHILLPVFNLSRLPAADNRGLFVLAMAVLAGGGAALLEHRDTESTRLARKLVSCLLLFYVISVAALPLIYGKPVEAVLSTVTFEAICMLLALLVLARFEGSRAVVLLAGIICLEAGFCATRNYEPIGHPISEGEYASITRHVKTFTPAGVNAPRLGDGANPVDQSSAEAFVAKKFHINDYNPLRLARFVGLIDKGFLPWMQSGPRVAALPDASDPQNYQEFQVVVEPVPYNIIEFTPNRVRYRVDLARDARLVFNEVYFPGWRARIDGQEQTVTVLAGGLRSLSVRTGTHDLIFEFKPLSYFVALGIALVGLLSLIAWVVWLHRKTRGVFASRAGADSRLFLGPREPDVS